MRSSKSRSRSKSNRSRSVGNIVNRVFDSSGPEGKVRGTPQQIIDKYTQLARDATLSNDRVAAENFQQHAEHYTRLLGEAQREQDARREQQEAQSRDQSRDQGRDRQRDRPEQSGDGSAGGGRGSQSEALQAVDKPQPDVIEDTSRSDPQPDLIPDPASDPQPDVIDVGGAGAADTGLVETPESKPKAPSRSRSKSTGRSPTRTRSRSTAKSEKTAEGEAAPATADAPEAAPAQPASEGKDPADTQG